MLPRAGVDVEAALGHARTYVANFPLPGRVLGDVDERAAVWLAQLLDEPPARERVREELRGLGDGSRPLTAGHLATWAGGEPPADPRADAPWMAAMLALARTQL